MADTGGDGGGRERFIFAGTPVNDVSVSVEGLRGETRAAAVAAAESIRSADTVGVLNDRVRAAAGAIAADCGREAAIVEVAAQPGDSAAVHVAFRAPPGSVALVDAGLRAPQGFGLVSCVSLEGESDLGQAAVHGCAGGTLDLGMNAIFASARASMFHFQKAGRTPAIELGVRMPGPGLTPCCGPRTFGPFASLSCADTTGRHAVRCQAAARDLVPESETSSSLWSDAASLHNTKVSVGYTFLSDTRPRAAGGDRGELRHASVELAGLLGDVSLARMEAVWALTQRNFPAFGLGSAILNVSAAAGLALPLAGDTLRYEDRFFLGGATGGPGERLPGFANRSVGPKVAAHGGTSDPSGGDARFTAGASLHWPIPQCGKLHAFAFGHAGAIGLIQESAATARASLGVGAGLPLPNGGFFGLTIARPLLAKAGDNLQQAQLSLSFSSTA